MGAPRHVRVVRPGGLVPAPRRRAPRPRSAVAPSASRSNYFGYRVALTGLGRSVEDDEVELVEAVGVGDHVDPGDSVAGDRDVPDDLRACHRAPTRRRRCRRRARAARAQRAPEKTSATAVAPRTSSGDPICTAAASARSTMSGSSTATSWSRSPLRDAARKASTTDALTPHVGAAAPASVPWTRRRARLASCFAALGERPRMVPISSNGTAKTSWSTNASRSAGARVSSTTCSAGPSASARSASYSGSPPASGSRAPRRGAQRRAPLVATRVRAACRGTRGSRRW